MILCTLELIVSVWCWHNLMMRWFQLFHDIGMFLCFTQWGCSPTSCPTVTACMIVKSLLYVDECLTLNINLLFSQLLAMISWNNKWYDGFLVLASSSAAVMFHFIFAAPALQRFNTGLQILSRVWTKDCLWPCASYIVSWLIQSWEVRHIIVSCSMTLCEKAQHFKPYELENILD
jgi:hypothetical protein